MWCEVAVAPLPVVFGQDQTSPVAITQISPSRNVPVGARLLLQGTINTLNGSYQILLDQESVATGKANKYLVSVYFNVPEVIEGTHTLTLTDLSTSTNATNQLQISTAYAVTPVPSSIQERSSTTLNVTVMGGIPDKSYTVSVSVVLPSPISSVYSKTMSLGTPDSKGTAAAQLIFPDSSFQPSGSLTDYAGSYTVLVNQTLAESHFTVGFLDAASYMRGQVVTVKATGYQPNQQANLTINLAATGETFSHQTVTASADGTISTIWAVPSNTPLGGYTAKITTLQGTPKAIVDSQTFTVTGYPIHVKTVNLAGEIVPQINIKALDLATNQLTNSTSGPDGIATLNLGSGSQSLTAFWNGVNVGQANLTVTGEISFNMQCVLTDLKVVVHNQIGVPLQFVNLSISYTYTPEDFQGTETARMYGQTDINGTYVLNSTLPGVSYTIEASIYNHVFNPNNKTFNSIGVVAQSQVLITCPNEALTLNVMGYNQAPISGARIELIEATNSLFYTATTNDSGSANSLVTFGVYRAKVYKDNILVNETNIEAFNSSQQQIHCTLYGIDVSVSVVDVFSNPIQKANVTLIGPSTERLTALTAGDGLAKFTDVIGGDMQILAFAQDSPNDYQALTVNVDQPTSVQIKLDQYVALGSFLVRVSTLVAIIIVVIAAVVLVAFEIYRRKKK
jgi:hypothetical protein